MRPASKSSSWSALIVCCGVGSFLLFRFDPASSHIFPPCPFHYFTGLNCPGCGTGRGLHQLLHGHLFAAFRLNPLMVLSLPFVLYAFARKLLRTAGLPLKEIFIPAKWIWVLFALIMFYWAFRNTSFYPFVH